MKGGKHKKPKEEWIDCYTKEASRTGRLEWILCVNLLYVITGFTDTFFHPSVMFFEQINPPQLPLSLPSCAC